MTDYFEEMGWRELGEGERPNFLLLLERFHRDYGLYGQNFSGEWPRLPPPASKEVVQKLPEVVIDAEGKDCSICLKKFNMNDKAKEMPCHHTFHSPCLLAWLSRTNSCPICRFELQSDDEAYEAFKKEKKRAKQREEDLDTLHNSMFS